MISGLGYYTEEIPYNHYSMELLRKWGRCQHERPDQDVNGEFWFGTHIDVLEYSGLEPYLERAECRKLAENMAKTGSLSIFPNPAADEIRVSGLSGKSLRYTVYNLYGQSVTSGRLEDQSIDVSHLKPGFYILEIRNDHSRYSGRFVKY